MTIYVIEIPHRGDPLAWMATDWRDYERIACSTWTDVDAERFNQATDHRDNLTAEERREIVMEVCGEDLSGYRVCDGEAEARELLAWLRSDQAPRFGQCGPSTAAAALERILPA